MTTPDLDQAREDLLTVLTRFGPQPLDDIAALADVLGLTEPVLAGLIEEIIEAGQAERFAASLRAAPEVAA